MYTLKVTSIGNSTGVVLPKELLIQLRVKKGDQLFAIETQNGVELSSYNPTFASQMDIAEKIMHRDKDILKKLAE